MGWEARARAKAKADGTWKRPAASAVIGVDMACGRDETVIAEDSRVQEVAAHSSDEGTYRRPEPGMRLRRRSSMPLMAICALLGATLPPGYKG